MKKIIVISASPRKGGNSDTLCNEFIKGAEEAGHEVEKIFLRDKKIDYCRACYYCRDHNGVCTIKDDVPAIIDKMIVADTIVLSTPVYFYSMNAQLKTIIDRSVMKWLEIKNKNFYLIATAAEDDEHAMEGTIKSFRGFLECLEGANEAGLILAGGVYQPGEITGHPALQQAYETAKTI